MATKTTDTFTDRCVCNKPATNQIFGNQTFRTCTRCGAVRSITWQEDNSKPDIQPKGISADK